MLAHIICAVTGIHMKSLVFGGDGSDGYLLLGLWLPMYNSDVLDLPKRMVHINLEVACRIEQI